jgi:hypothetical protein
MSSSARGRIILRARSNQQPHNKTLHPTAYSSVRRASSLRFRRRVSLSFYRSARLGGCQEKNVRIINMNAGEIEEEIRAAFKGVKLDGGISLRQAKVIDNYGEGITNEEFAGLPQKDITNDWTALSPELLDEYCIIPHFDAKGFRYYIPAYLLSVLHDYGYLSERASSTLYSLYPKKDHLWDYHMMHYSLLTSQQRSAIAHFLQALPDLVALDGEDNKIVERSIRNFWHQYL